MGYIIGFVLLIIVVPLLFLMLSRRTTSAGGLENRSRDRDRGVTVSKPSSDQPTPRANATNQSSPEVERRLPPG